MNEFVGKLRKGIIKGDGDLTIEFEQFISKCRGSVIVEKKQYTEHFSMPNQIIFECEEDLTVYLLTFEEVDQMKVILPVIRRVMPTIIANEIIGVAPMTGPIGAMRILRDRYNV